MPAHVPGKRNTRQRDAILVVLREAAGPLTVDEIHDRGREHVRGLGIATVYRNVRLLLDAGEIHGVTLPTGETRYESTARGHHHHFQCLICDRVFDLDGCPVSAAYEASLPAGFTVEDHEITLYGTCAGCGAG